MVDQVRAGLQTRIEHTLARMDATPPPAPDGMTERELRGDLLAAQTKELTRLYDIGAISDATRRLLQCSLDLEATRLTDDQR